MVRGTDKMTMEEVNISGTCPELKDLETKLGIKTPESLLRSMREHYASDERALGTDERLPTALPEELIEKIKNLKLQMGQLRSADVKILRQFLILHEGMEMLRWLQGDRSTLTSLTGSQSSLGDVAFVAQETGGESPSCCSHTPEITHGPCPSPSGSTQGCSTSLEDSGEIAAQAWTSVCPPIGKQALPQEGSTAHLTEQNALTEGTWQMVCPEDPSKIALPAQCIGLAQSNTQEHEVFDRCEGSSHVEKEETELSLGQSEALLGYDTHWCWVESKDDVTFL